jgi:hypothetical protein
MYRMEMNLCALIRILDRFFLTMVFSEIMICDFTSHMEVVSFSNLDTPRIGARSPTGLPEDQYSGEQPLSMVW